MKPPRFWFRSPTHPGIWPRVLAPFGALYAFGTQRRLDRGARAQQSVPVIAVGNVNLGGTGKTPTVIALIEYLATLGERPAVVTRGYGGSVIGPHRVDIKTDRAKEVGDEALLLASFAPVYVSPERVPGARLAIADGCSVIILDDALQNPALHHDLTITVMDAEIGFGNGRVAPAGPLREPVSKALARTDIVIAIGANTSIEAQVSQWPILKDHALLSAALHPLPTGFSWDGLRAYAFAGIGRPQKFFTSLKEVGAQLIVTRAFDDHEPYALALLKRMQAEAWAKDCNLVTTEKDAARLPPEMRAEVLTFPVRLVLEDPEPLLAALSALFVKR